MRGGPGGTRRGRALPEHVLVTGGSGKLGRAVVDRLVTDGQPGLGRRPRPAGRDDVAWTRADLTDFGQAVGVLTGVDDRWPGPEAVVHLAALPAPGLRPDATLFAGQRHHDLQRVLRGPHRRRRAHRVGLERDRAGAALRRAAAAPAARRGLRPGTDQLLLAVQDAGGGDGRQFARWQPQLSITGLRFSNVMEVADYAAFPGFDADPAARRWNAWSYIDARDGAGAVVAALAHAAPGADVFVVANAEHGHAAQQRGTGRRLVPRGAAARTRAGQPGADELGEGGPAAGLGAAAQLARRV